jgi:hypothetical protein
LVTGSYGFGGWSYSNGVNLSGYKYLVAKLGNTNASSVSFRLFDENSYWTTPAQYDFGSERMVVANLANMYKTGTTTKMDPNHIYIAGFWSSGDKPIVIENVYLTNNDNYLPMAIKEISNKDIDENEPVEIYTVMGVKIKSHIKRKEAAIGLCNGVYIVGNRKVIVIGRF